MYRKLEHPIQVVSLIWYIISTLFLVGTIFVSAYGVYIGIDIRLQKMELEQSNSMSTLQNIPTMQSRIQALEINDSYRTQEQNIIQKKLDNIISRLDRVETVVGAKGK